MGVGLVLVSGLGMFFVTLSTGEEADDRCPLGEWLDLPTEQCRPLCGVDPDFKAEARALAADLREQREAFASLLEDTQSTDEAILAQSEQVIATHDALERRVVRHILLIRPHLTPAQQQRLMGLCAEGIRQWPDYPCTRGPEGGAHGAAPCNDCKSDGCCGIPPSNDEG
jgi:rubredoxin